MHHLHLRSAAIIVLTLFCSAAYAQQGQPGTSVLRRPARPSAAAARAPARTIVQHGPTPTVLPGTSESAFTTIQGNALNSTSGSLPNSIVRLRDARLGGIVDTQLTDGSGLFSFRAVDPGSYVVELMGDDQTVLAASQVLDVDAGQAVTAIVRLPFRIPALAGLLGHSAGQAATVASAAAAAGVLGTSVTLSDASPQ
jgi:hypothetical protein